MLSLLTLFYTTSDKRNNVRKRLSNNSKSAKKEGGDSALNSKRSKFLGAENNYGTASAVQKNKKEVIK